MTIRKTVLARLDKCYATAAFEIGGELKYIVATEGVGPCIAWPDSTRVPETVWEGPGGTMNIVPIPGYPDQFLATQDFVPTFQAKESKVVHVTWKDGEWTVRHLMTVPYLHRFDIREQNGKRYFIGATLALYKESKDDWTKPGAVYVGELPEVLDGPFPIRPVLSGITKNHGFCRCTWKGRAACLVSGVEGLFAVYLPKAPGEEWETECLINHEVSDMAVCDIDGDGLDEIATIEPFHGSSGRIYHQTGAGMEAVLEHEYEFGHVVWGGTIAGKPAFVIGGRKGNRELNIFTWNAASSDFDRTLVDNSGGPSNIAVWHKPDMDVILAANREIGEVALYEIEP